MTRGSLTLRDFAKSFRGAIRFDFDFERPLYTLILGAGASRSAGIPLASEMLSALKSIARARGIQLKQPRNETLLSSAFRTLFPVQARKQQGRSPERFVNSSREFLLGCIHLAEKEANLTHLIAAHLCTAGILNPIVTTNFDDLALAAFWHLPWIRTDDEPHVIYDPEGAVLSNPRIAEGVPIILKAHGHHTTYALGYLDRQIAHAAPYVRALMANLPRSTHGYIVAGYSGTWDDGVMKALSDTDLTQNKTIYWLYRGKTEPKGPLIDRVCRNADVRFVQIPGSDQAFLELWAAVPEDDGDGENISSAFSIGRHLGVEHLISCRSGWQPHTRRWPRTGYDWFNPSLINEDGSWRCQDQMRLDELRKELLPILERIEEVDRKYMKYACVLRGKLPSRVLKELDEAEVKLEELANRVPVAVPWTRRNRTLLRLGLSTGTDLQLATLLLSAFSSYSARQLPL